MRRLGRRAGRRGGARRACRSRPSSSTASTSRARARSSAGRTPSASSAWPRIVAPGSLLPRLVTGDADEAERFFAQALEAGHEGLMAKSLTAPYAAGQRGFHWLKLKPRHTLDLVVLAVERGSGRRQRWLSNLHLGARDAESGQFVMLGKTFKGLTDEMLEWQTRGAPVARRSRRDGWVVHVRPELVVEIAFSDVQESPALPGRPGAALRARQALPAREARGRGRHAAGRAGDLRAPAGLKRSARATIPRARSTMLGKPESSPTSTAARRRAASPTPWIRTRPSSDPARASRASSASEGPVDVAGTLEGDAHVAGHCRIRPGAKVSRAGSRRRRSSSRARSTGPAIVADRVEIGATARVRSSVEARLVAIADGAFFEGARAHGGARRARDVHGEAGTAGRGHVQPWTTGPA